MKIATRSIEVGVRDLKNNLSRYVAGVVTGTDVVVTDRGRPVARLVKIDDASNRLADLIEVGLVIPAATRSRRVPKRIVADEVSDLVDEQRR